MFYYINLYVLVFLLSARLIIFFIYLFLFSFRSILYVRHLFQIFSVSILRVPPYVYFIVGYFFVGFLFCVHINVHDFSIAFDHFQFIVLVAILRYFSSHWVQVRSNVSSRIRCDSVYTVIFLITSIK